MTTHRWIASHWHRNNDGWHRRSIVVDATDERNARVQGAIAWRVPIGKVNAGYLSTVSIGAMPQNVNEEFRKEG